MADDTSKKIDELQATVNRLSANFEAYAAQHPPAYVSIWLSIFMLNSLSEF